MVRLYSNTLFLRLFSGRLITDAGDSLYYIAAMWLVWELTGSPFYTGLAGALIQVPNALSFLVGPLVDRWELRRILVSTQVINGVGVLVVPLAATMGYLSVWVILVVMPVLTFVNRFVYPAQNAALPRIVEKDQLTRANSLFSTSSQTVDMVANAIAGVLIAIIGAVTLFVVNSVSFAIAALLFLGVTVPTAADHDDAEEAQSSSSTEVENDDRAENGDETDEGYLSELREGIDYVRGSVLWPLLLGAMITNSVAIAANAVLPAFADGLGGPEAYGLLLAAMAAGSLVGVGGAFLVEDYSLSWIAIVGFPLTGLLWIAAVVVSDVWPTAILLAIALVPVGMFNVVFSSMLQSAVDNALLGRITSLTASLSATLMPLGALFGGAVASAIGSVTVMYGAGGAVVVLGLYFLAHPQLRSLPPVTEADETALGLQSAVESTPVGVGTKGSDCSE